MKWDDKVFWFWCIIALIFDVFIFCSPNLIFAVAVSCCSAFCVLFGWWLSKIEEMSEDGRYNC